MKPKYIVLLLLFTTFKLLGQSATKIIEGKIINDSLSVENIHIINKNSHKATISNPYGEFQIPVQRNDTILISSIQFEHKTIIITDVIIKSKKLPVYVFPKINLLEEVEIKTRHLLGNLTSDAGNVKDSISKMNPLATDFSMIDFKKPVISDIDETDRLKPPDISHLVSPIQPGISASFALKKLQSKEAKKLNAIKKKTAILDEIRNSINDVFFIKKLNIPKEEINSFIYYCKSKGIIQMYLTNQKIEMIDILIEESKNYLNLSKK